MQTQNSQMNYLKTHFSLNKILKNKINHLKTNSFFNKKLKNKINYINFFYFV